MAPIEVVRVSYLYLDFPAVVSCDMASCKSMSHYRCSGGLFCKSYTIGMTFDEKFVI